MIFSALWHALPWWSWLVIGGGALLIVFVPGAALAFGKLIAAIPWTKWQTYVVLALIAAPFGFRIWLDLHDQKLLAAAKQHEVTAVAGRDTYWQGLIKKANDNYAQQLADLQKWIDGEKVKGDARAKVLADQAAAERARAQKAQDQLSKERHANVTDEAARLCTITRGVVLQFNAGAAYANGGDELAVAAAASAGSFAVDAPAGVTLDTYTRAVEGAQHALRDCHAQVTGWQAYYASLQPWIANAIEVANRCTPSKGSQ